MSSVITKFCRASPEQQLTKETIPEATRENKEGISKPEEANTEEVAKTADDDLKKAKGTIEIKRVQILTIVQRNRC